MLKLKLQYFGHLMPTDNSLEKYLTFGKIEGRERGHQRMRWLDGLFDVMDMNLGDDEGQGSCAPCGCIQLDMTGQLNNNNNKGSKKLALGKV